MKRHHLILTFLLLTGILQAQIPNSGFESWTSAGSYEVPDQWGNMNAATSSSGVYTTSKGTPGATGNYYIKLSTKDVAGVITPGIIVSGKLNTVTWQPEKGFPYSKQAEKLTGKYQFMGYNSDVATIAAWLTKWNYVSHKRDTIASLHYNTSGMIHVWTDFEIPFAYRSSEIPDTAVVMISSSSTSPKKNSFIWLDDLKLEGLVTSVHESESSAKICIYPSPAIDVLTLSIDSKVAAKTKINIYNLQGKLLYNSDVELFTGLNAFKINTNEFCSSPGLYVLNLPLQGKQITVKFFAE